MRLTETLSLRFLSLSLSLSLSHLSSYSAYLYLYFWLYKPHSELATSIYIYIHLSLSDQEPDSPPTFLTLFRIGAFEAALRMDPDPDDLDALFGTLEVVLRMDPDPDDPAALVGAFDTALWMYQDPDDIFYLYRQCRTHLALTDEFVSKDTVMEAAILENVKNVDVAGPEHYRMERANTVADVNCTGCRSLLGWKFVEVPEENDVVMTGRFLLYLNKLLKWDGKNIRYADTLMATFGQTPDVHFYLCRQCSTHLVLTINFMRNFADVIIDDAGIFANVVNVDVVGKAHYRMKCDNTVADIHCNGCREVLGWKFVGVPQERIVVLTGRFVLHWNRMLRWDGNNMLYADTNEPVESA